MFARSPRTKDALLRTSRGFAQDACSLRDDGDGVKEKEVGSGAAAAWHGIIALFQSFDYWAVPGPWTLLRAMVWRPFGAWRWKRCEPQRGDTGKTVLARIRNRCRGVAAPVWVRFGGKEWMNPVDREARLKPAGVRGIRPPLPPPEDGGSKGMPAEARQGWDGDAGGPLASREKS